MTAKNPSSSGPMPDSVKECTESSTPDRVRNVPRIVSANVAVDERQVPHAQHPATLLHKHGVQVRGGGQPRQERRVLHGVPRPEAAPPEDLVGPPRAEHDAHAEQPEGHERPAPHRQHPCLVDATGDERRDRERERHREADVPGVEDRRVERHERVVLQQRVRAGAVGRDRALHGVERISRSQQQHEEERGRRRT